ncbi:hypothetical protein A3K86_21135 [Photobacterium jeanii]|uniref:OmpR/PhoB-type domain-containing protein n=2 Tax=Photobacterium jeanii TaxID=858640 RepID=A0A178K2A5_9GAMM|nr:winged helix-turn-helix domain-containing protein [Photobacterium jeanii]OAN11448.1 hypothetical protein A3K86_21135 [Photobacterium jeanii]PST90967.1 transcriptional regulator [Photobacterium jeanii]
MSSAVNYRLDTDPEIIFIPEQNRLLLNKEERHLEPLQARMLHFFIHNQGKVQSAKMLADAVWERSHVSDNLVRQVISQLRNQLNDQHRPYSIIKTIPKQGYLFDIEVNEIKEATALSNNPKQDTTPPPTSKQETFTAPTEEKRKRAKRQVAVLSLLSVFTLSAMGLGYYALQDSSDNAVQPIINEVNNEHIIPVIFHELVLDQNKDLTIARNVYNYLFFGLNSSNNIVGYHYSQMTSDAKKQLTPEAISLKGWIKETHDGYHIKLLLDNPNLDGKTKELDKTFSKEDFFSAIGDLVLSLKTTISPTASDYGFANHRVTSVNSYNDWQVISKGISLFYQGKNADSFKLLLPEFDKIKQQGRDNYLLDALFAYAASMQYLNDHLDDNKQQALIHAKAAFEKNPRCNIANISLGLALIVNNHSEQAYPYLFYAAENSPSPLSYYLLSVADSQADNPKGAEYNYQRFTRLSHGQSAQLAELKASLQKSNLFPATK